MTSTKKSVEFQAKNVKAFRSWLKRFACIDNSLLLEIDEKSSSFIAKSYNEEHSVIKFSKINFDDAGLVTKTGKDTKRIKAGIFNIPRLIKIMDQFNDVEFNLSVNYDEIIGNDSKVNYAAKDIQLKNKTLKMCVDCTTLDIFKYITDERFQTFIQTNAVGEFELSETDIEKLSSLCILDNEHKFIEFKSKDNKVYASGKTFELLLGEMSGAEAALNVFKNQFSNVDIENYDVKMGEDRLIFTSKDSETVSVISMAIVEE